MQFRYSEKQLKWSSDPNTEMGFSSRSSLRYEFIELTEIEVMDEPEEFCTLVTKLNHSQPETHISSVLLGG